MEVGFQFSLGEGSVLYHSFYFFYEEVLGEIEGVLARWYVDFLGRIWKFDEGLTLFGNYCEWCAHGEEYSMCCKILERGVD